MKIEAQKYELAFIWTKNPTGYRWEDCEPCDMWGEPFSEWEEQRRTEFEEAVQPIPSGPFLADVFAPLGLMPYHPFENPILFAQFADVKPEKESFLEWANENGRLVDVENTLENMVYIFPEYIPVSAKSVKLQRDWDMCIIGKDGRYFRRAKADPLRFWIREHRDFSFTLMLWEFAMNSDPRLDGIVEYHSDTRRVYINEFPKEKLSEIDFGRLGKDPTYGPDFVRPPYKLFGYLPEKLDMKEAALRYIQETISKKLAVFPLRFVFRMDDDGKFRKIIEPTSLLSAMWYQFYLALTGEIRLRRCSICGRWENMEGHRETWKKHANCANYGRVKLARLKKKLRKRSLED